MPTTFFATDPADVVGSGSGSLRQAVLDANAHPGPDTIQINSGTFALSIAGAGEDAAATGDLDLTDPVTVTGAGADSTVIDAASLDRAFQVFGVAVLISGVTIENGFAPQGGGIENDGGSLTIRDSTITGNQAEGVAGDWGNNPGGDARGGGIANIGGSLMIDHAIISANTAYGGRGGLGRADYFLPNGGMGGTARGGGIDSEDGPVSIMHSVVSGNIAGGGGGGDGDSFSFLDQPGLFGGDGGAGGWAAGGGLYIDATATSLTLADSIVTDNQALGGGGGRGGWGTTSSGFVYHGGEIGPGGSGSGGEGGGADLSAATISLTAVTFTDNRAVGGSGGSGGAGGDGLGRISSGIGGSGGAGGAGAGGIGGGLIAGSSASLSITLGNFAGNSAIGGNGGNGGDGGVGAGGDGIFNNGDDGIGGNGGSGGSGGPGLGGGLIGYGLDGFAVIQTAFAENRAVGGDGGDGGSGGGGYGGAVVFISAYRGGNGYGGDGGRGGDGGNAAGGGLTGYGLYVPDSTFSGDRAVGGAGGSSGGGYGSGGVNNATYFGDEGEPTPQPGDGYGGSAIGGEGGWARGGALDNSGGSLRVTGSAFSGDQATAGAGGGASPGSGVGGRSQYLDFNGSGYDGHATSGDGGSALGGAIDNGGPSVGPVLKQNQYAGDQVAAGLGGPGATNGQALGPDVYGVALQVNRVIVNGGALQRSNVDTIAVEFNQPSNLQALIDDGSVANAVGVATAGGAAVPLPAGHYKYDPATGALAIDLTVDGFSGSLKTLLADGRYQLRLTSAAIEARGVPGSKLLDTDGTVDGVYRSDFLRLLGDFTGDGAVSLADRTPLLARFGTAAGQSGYDFAFDLNGDGVVNVADYLLWTRRLGQKV